MINPIEDYYEQKVLYLYEGKAWKLIAYCPTPSVTMECVTTKEQMNFGIGGLTARKFKLIEEKRMANLDDLNIPSISEMQTDEAIELLRQIRLSRRIPTRKAVKKKPSTPKVSPSDAAELLKLIGE